MCNANRLVCLLLTVALAVAAPAAGQLACVGSPPLRIEKGPYGVRGFELTAAEYDTWLAQVRASCAWGAISPWGAAVANVAALPACNAARDGYAYVVLDTGAGARGIYQCTNGVGWASVASGGPDDDVPEVGDFGALDPSACPASQWANDITAGALVCAQPAFSDVSGAVTDAQVPDTITVDLATLATTATTANTGDSATAFFSVGTLEDARLSANVSLLGQTIEAAEVAADVATQAELDLMAPLAGATFTGAVGVDNGLGFRLFEADVNGANYVEFVAPAALTATTTCTLENDGNPIPDSCVGDGTDGGGVPGGLDAYVQYNDDGAFGGDADFTFTETGNVLTLASGQLNVDNLRLDGNALSVQTDNLIINAGPNNGSVTVTNGFGTAAVTAYVFSGGAGNSFRLHQDFGLLMKSAYTLGWSSSSDPGGTIDTVLSRSSDAVVKIDNALRLDPITAPPVTCGDANTEGVVYSDSDGSKALCWCNGTAWEVAAGSGTCS